MQAQIFSLNFFQLPVVRFHAMFKRVKASDKGESLWIVSCEKNHRNWKCLAGHQHFVARLAVDNTVSIYSAIFINMAEYPLYSAIFISVIFVI